MWIIETLHKTGSPGFPSESTCRMSRFPESSRVALMLSLELFGDSTFEFIAIGGPP